MTDFCRSRRTIVGVINLCYRLPSSLFLAVLCPLFGPPGEYDALIPWPFQLRVTMMLLDQCENSVLRRNITEVFRPDARSASFKRPTGEMNTGESGPSVVLLLFLSPGLSVCLFICPCVSWSISLWRKSPGRRQLNPESIFECLSIWLFVFLLSISLWTGLPICPFLLYAYLFVCLYVCMSVWQGQGGLNRTASFQINLSKI